MTRTVGAAHDTMRLALPQGDGRGLAALHDASWVMEPPDTAARA